MDLFSKEFGSNCSSFSDQFVKNKQKPSIAILGIVHMPVPSTGLNGGEVCDSLKCTLKYFKEYQQLKILSHARGAGSPVNRQSSKPRRDTVR